MLPNQIYAADYGDFQITIYQQTVGKATNYTANKLTSRPKTEIGLQINPEVVLTYTGAPEDKAQYKVLGVSFAPLNTGEERPQFYPPLNNVTSSSANNFGAFSSSVSLREDWDNEITADWDNIIAMGGGGTSVDNPFISPDCYALDFYINGTLAAELTLLPAAN